MSTELKYVYSFGDAKADGDATLRNLLGGKGANLAEMTNIGLPVPAGFTITTDVCNYYDANDQNYPPELKSQVDDAIKSIERIMDAEFGSTRNPLLLSCRSGARESLYSRPAALSPDDQFRGGRSFQFSVKKLASTIFPG